MTHDGPTPDRRLSRLRLIGLAAPPLFVLALLCLVPVCVETVGQPGAHLLIGGVLILSAAVFGWTMYQALGRAHEAAVEAERMAAALLERDRIARELHDSLAQVLGVTHLRLRALSGRPGMESDPLTRAEVDDLADLCQEGHRDVREAILGLKDARRPDRALLDQLDDYVRVFARTSGVATTLVTDADRGLSLPPGVEVQVIRVVQEALSNVRKHAGARSATVMVHANDTHTDFVVDDDGRGFARGDTRGTDGFGLTTMRERTESVGGTLRVESTPGGGTTVTVRLPQRAGSRARVEELTA